MQTPSTFTRRINLSTRDLKLASPQISFNCFRRKKKLRKKKLNFLSKTKILINFVELFDSKTNQRLLHSSFVTQKQNLRLFLQKFDRYESIPLRTEAPCSNVKTNFIKSSSFRQVFGLFFVAIFTQDKEIVWFHYILLNLFLKTKYTIKLLL